MSSSEKQRALYKKRRLRHQRKKSEATFSAPPNTLVIHEPPGMAKMSKVLEDFVEPFMEPNMNEDAIRLLFTLGAIAWNAALLPPDEQEKVLRETPETLPPAARDTYRAFVHPLIARKRQHFADIPRAIYEVKLTMLPSGPYVQVMSSTET